MREISTDMCSTGKKRIQICYHDNLSFFYLQSYAKAVTTKATAAATITTTAIATAAATATVAASGKRRVTRMLHFQSSIAKRAHRESGKTYCNLFSLPKNCTII